jgi:NADPH:quinone reductase-like Zn-dependent oxidoreductase
MKAVVYTHYGSPDVLQFTDVATPVPADDEVLIRVHAAAANPADWHLMRAKPFLARFANGLLKPKNTKLGADVAGRIAAVGSNVTQLHVGDAVFGCLPVHALGSFAEYVCAAEALVALKPAKLTFEQAAAVPLAAFTALQGLRNAGQIQSGQTVLINGASGGVGTFAVQLAKAFGTDVTGVCSTRNVDLVRSIGANQVIDYTQTDFTKNGQQYDLIFDAVGNRSVADYKRALRPNGKCVVAGFTTLSRLFQVLVLGAWASRTGSQKIGLMETAKPNQNDLALLKELLEAGTVVPVIDRCYPFREGPEASRYLEAGHARGKVIITVEPTNQP